MSKSKKTQAGKSSADTATPVAQATEQTTNPATVAAAIETFEDQKPVAAEVQTSDTEVKQPRSVVPKRYKQKYGKVGHCGDSIAATLAAFLAAKDADGRDSIALDKLREVAAANDVDFAPYASLNHGMQRMNVANRLRGLVNHGHDIVIGETKIAGKAPTPKQVEDGEKKAA